MKRHKEVPCKLGGPPASQGTVSIRVESVSEPRERGLKRWGHGSMTVEMVLVGMRVSSVCDDLLLLKRNICYRYGVWCA